MRYLLQFSRVFVGALFLFSGLVKANDTVGFSYKLMEYWEVFGLHFLTPISLVLAAFICVFEVVIGAAILFRWRIKLSAWLLLLMILFFTFLTFYSAYFEKVTGCGCFGDAIPLTPWQSFTKDVILLVFVLIIFFNKNKLAEENYETRKEENVLLVLAQLLVSFAAIYQLQFNQMWIFSFILLGVSMILKYGLPKNISGHALGAWLFLSTCVFCYITYAHLPFRDFRAYAIGKNIPEQMQGIPDVLKYYYNLKDKKTGEIKEFEKFPENYEQNYDYVDFRTEVITKGNPAKILDFNIVDADGNDVTQDLLNNESYSFLLISYNLDKTNVDAHLAFNELANKAQNAGYQVMGLSASTFSKIDEHRHNVQAMFPYFNMDETTLKTIIRSNPGLVILKKGTVIGQWHYNDFPSFETLKSEVLK